MNGFKKLLLFSVLVPALGIIQKYEIPVYFEKSSVSIYLPEGPLFDVKDTLYTFDDAYFEVNLATQRGIIHRRNLPPDTILVSTGTDLIDRGMKTTTGIFKVYDRGEYVMSTLWPGTALIFWQEITYGVGIHGLEGWEYYQYLGKQPMSHGCVRVSREDGKVLYETLKDGSIVFVHYGNNSVTVGFANAGENYNVLSTNEIKSEIKKRAAALFFGNYNKIAKNKILLIDKNIPQFGFTVGNNERLKGVQKKPLQDFEFIEINSDRLTNNIKVSLNENG